MITELIINMLFASVTLFLTLIPQISFTIPADIVSNLTDFFHVIFYFVPVSTFLSIVGVSVALHSFRTIISLIKTIWNLLPFV